MFFILPLIPFFYLMIEGINCVAAQRNAGGLRKNANPHYINNAGMTEISGNLYRDGVTRMGDGIICVEVDQLGFKGCKFFLI